MNSIYEGHPREPQNKRNYIYTDIRINFIFHFLGIQNAINTIK